VSESALQVSIVIPVFNEARILRATIEDLITRLGALGQSYEIILAENGSRDGTLAIARELAAEHDSLVFVSMPTPNYGQALRLGIESAKGRYVICDEIDLVDTNFHAEALALLDQDRADLVIGSKLIGGAKDERPLIRHALSLAYTASLRLCLGFKGTDTHGLKALRRSVILPVVRACRIDGDVFASELVIRAYRSGVRVVEVPTRTREKRPPSIHVWRRVPGVLKNFAKLCWTIRFNGS
jgi:glycosyltransferase involved in cell wall biosynthesis